MCEFVCLFKYPLGHKHRTRIRTVDVNITYENVYHRYESTNSYFLHDTDNTAMNLIKNY